MQQESSKRWISESTEKALINHFGEEGLIRVRRVLIAALGEYAFDPSHNRALISSFKNNPHQLTVLEEKLRAVGKLPLVSDSPETQPVHYSTRNNGGSVAGGFTTSTDNTDPKTGTHGDLYLTHPTSETQTLTR